MNLHHLRIFYTVAQVRSITAAAGELLLSQPAVSLQRLRFREFATAPSTSGGCP